jgi:aspartyl/asparaginyl beta-hydroxylase (cupin superfamily)
MDKEHCLEISAIMKKAGYFNTIMAGGVEFDRLKHYLHILAGEQAPVYQHPLQNPRYPCFPGLQYQPWHDVTTCPGAMQLQSHFQTIQQEALALAAPHFLTYIPKAFGLKQKLASYLRALGLLANKANRAALPNGGWTLYTLYYMGIAMEAWLQQCPRTFQIINSLPRLCTAYPWGDALFSMLAPGAYLPPHCSVDSLRVRCHLGISIPEGCGIRVGEGSRQWQQGQCLLFEDGFQHEVWNHSTTNRLVLIVDFWHPDLTELEIKALTAGFRHPQIRQLFYKQRLNLTNAKPGYVKYLEQALQRHDPLLLQFWPG